MHRKQAERLIFELNGIKPLIKRLKVKFGSIILDDDISSSHLNMKVPQQQSKKL